ncbi:MAG: hypothetical protein ACK5MT_10515 [Actinomycetales bacterium]
MTAVADIVETSIDGVQTFWAPVEGPRRAALSFRCGQADETYLTSGRSHLVEHLALYGIEDPSRHNNGYVDSTTTTFHTAGTDDHVSAFLAGVCRQLKDLPLHRLDREREVLAAEDASRRQSLAGLTSTWRFGAQGYGLAGLPRHGERLQSALDVQRWAHTRFTRENAVLWLSGPPPSDLRLSLPGDGYRMPAPEVQSLLGHGASWFCADLGGVGLSSLLPRDPMTMLVVRVLAEQLHDRLRVDQGLTYSPWVNYDRFGDSAHVTVFADGTQASLDPLAQQLALILAGLSRIDDDAVQAARARRIEEADEAEAHHPAEMMLSLLQGRAHDALHQRPHIDPREALHGHVRLAAFRRRATTLLEHGLYVLPSGIRPPVQFGDPLPLSLAPPLVGPAHSHADAPVVTDTLIVAAEGVARDTPGGQLVARYDDVVAGLSYPDGAVCLVASDGTHVMVEPTLWTDGAALAKKITRAIGQDRIATMPARAAADIPRPQTTWWDRFKVTALRRDRKVMILAIVALLAITPFLVVLDALPLLFVLITLTIAWMLGEFAVRRDSRRRRRRPAT